jgi:hypothetical protein
MRERIAVGGCGLIGGFEHHCAQGRAYESLSDIAWFRHALFLIFFGLFSTKDNALGYPYQHLCCFILFSVLV